MGPLRANLIRSDRGNNTRYEMQDYTGGFVIDNVISLASRDPLSIRLQFSDSIVLPGLAHR